MIKMIEMKRLIYILITGWAALGLNSCDQDVNNPYSGKDRIQFRHFTTDYTGTRMYSDSLVFSFGLIPEDIKTDTARIVMEYLGKGAGHDRSYHVTIVQDSTTAKLDMHYAAFPEKQTFQANSLTDTLKIVIFREHLSKSFTRPQNISLRLKLVPSEDFDPGLTKGIEKRVLLNNYLSEPEWWEGNLRGLLGFYHPKKWQLLIGVNKEAFSSYTSCPFDQNTGAPYRKWLDEYLKANEVFDDETGDRIFIDRLEPQV